MVALLAAGALHVVGRFGATTSSVWSTLGASVFELVGLALAVATLVVLVRRDAFTAAPIALFTGVVLLISGGLADVAELSHSQVATTLAGVVEPTDDHADDRGGARCPRDRVDAPRARRAAQPGDARCAVTPPRRREAAARLRDGDGRRS